MDSIESQVLEYLQALHRDMDQYGRVIESLQRLDTESVFRVLSEVLHHADPRLRANAAEMLAKLFDRRATAGIVGLLDDPDSTVRWHACGLLYDLCDPRAAADLIKVIVNDSDADVRLFAANALAKVGDASALPALQRARDYDQGEDWEGRKVSAAAARAFDEISARVANA